MFRHGLRVSEAITLKWDAVMIAQKAIGITRLKGSVSGIHPLDTDEIEALEDLKAEGYPGLHLFVSERGGHLSRRAVTSLIACKWLIQQRFKRVGMRWSEDGFNHLLILRLTWVNERFDSLFPGVTIPKSKASPIH
ncbi:hypothetical protein AM10699_66450 (plasmid) [Acaryochloris marina MBIC10699]|nr:hypothetical protein AM10699_66450 [Acaryochloris marina MBIC10699]